MVPYCLAPTSQPILKYGYLIIPLKNGATNVPKSGICYSCVLRKRDSLNNISCETGIFDMYDQIWSLCNVWWRSHVPICIPSNLKRATKLQNCKTIHHDSFQKLAIGNDVTRLCEVPCKGNSSSVVAVDENMRYIPQKIHGNSCDRSQLVNTRESGGLAKNGFTDRITWSTRWR